MINTLCSTYAILSHNEIITKIEMQDYEIITRQEHYHNEVLSTVCSRQVTD